MSDLKYVGDLVHTTKYTDRQTGEEKKKYTNVGAKFVRADGSETYRFLDSWVNFYPSEDKQNNSTPPTQQDTSEVQF